MASTNYITGTVISAEWLNDLNAFFYTLFAGATTAAQARTALGLGTISTQAASAVAITGGTISGTTISGYAPSGVVTGSGLTMNTARLLGRTTASSGAIEELTVGTDLTLSGGSLTVSAASTVLAGKVELLTQAEYDAGTDTTRAPTASLNKITLATPQASTSGTSILFTGIPSGVRKITMSLSGVSTNGTTGLRVRIGPSGGVETSAYLAGFGFTTAGASAGAAGTTAGFDTTTFGANSDTASGQINLTLLNESTNLWAVSGAVYFDAASDYMCTLAGTKAIAGVLERISLTTTGGDTFDAGSVNIQYSR